MIIVGLLTTFLAPFLPFSLKLGDKASKKVGEKFGEDAWNKAKAVWAKLQLKMEANDAAKETVTDVASNLEDGDVQASLRVQLKKLLDQDQALAEAICQIMKANAPSGTPETQIIQTVTGNQNQVNGQVAGGQVFGNVSSLVMMNGSGNTPSPKSPID